MTALDDEHLATLAKFEERASGMVTGNRTTASLRLVSIGLAECWGVSTLRLTAQGRAARIEAGIIKTTGAP